MMSSNFERFSQMITLDTMKKKTSTNVMPYISFVILDDMNKFQVCCEALMIGTTFKAYELMSEACFKMTPPMKREDIQCIFSKKFLTTNFLVSLELHNTKLFLIITN